MPSSYILPDPAAYEAPVVIHPPALSIQRAVANPTSLATVQSRATAVEWLWTDQGIPDWTTASIRTRTDQAALNLAKSSIWTWTAEDELAHQRILAKRAVEEYLQGGSSSLDTQKTFLGDVSTSPSELGGGVEITSFDEVLDRVQGVFAFVKNIDDVVDDLALWAAELNDDVKLEYLELFHVTCEVFARDRWGPERNLRLPEGDFTWTEFNEATDNIQDAYLFAEVWAKFYRRDLISFETFNQGCAILWCDCDECDCDEEELEILEHVYTAALKLTETPFYCSELEHVQAQLRAVRRALTDRAFERYLEQTHVTEFPSDLLSTTRWP